MIYNLKGKYITNMCVYNYISSSLTLPQEWMNRFSNLGLSLSLSALINTPPGHLYKISEELE